MFCSGEELLNSLNKSAKLGGGFKRTELFIVEFSMWRRNLCLTNLKIVEMYYNTINITKDQLILEDINSQQGPVYYISDVPTMLDKVFKNKMVKSSKTGQEKKSLVFIFTDYF